jgi:hypothetical protein
MRSLGGGALLCGAREAHDFQSMVEAAGVEPLPRIDRTQVIDFANCLNCQNRQKRSTEVHRGYTAGNVAASTWSTRTEYRGGGVYFCRIDLCANRAAPDFHTRA